MLVCLLSPEPWSCRDFIRVMPWPNRQKQPCLRVLAIAWATLVRSASRDRVAASWPSPACVPMTRVASSITRAVHPQKPHVTRVSRAKLLQRPRHPPLPVKMKRPRWRRPPSPATTALPRPADPPPEAAAWHPWRAVPTRGVSRCSVCWCCDADVNRRRSDGDLPATRSALSPR